MDIYKVIVMTKTTSYFYLLECARKTSDILFMGDSGKTFSFVSFCGLCDRESDQTLGSVLTKFRSQFLNCTI